MKQIGHLSNSAISLWYDCPRAFWAKYIEGEELPAGPAAAFGTLFEHSVAAKMGLLKEPKLDPTNVDHAEVAGAASKYMRWDKGWKTADVIQKKIEITPTAWANYADLYGVDSEIHVPIIGYTDFQRRNGITTEILDTKTSKYKGFKPAWAIQLNLYGMAERAARVGVHLYLRQVKPGFESYWWTPNKASFAWMMAYIGHAAKQIQVALLRDDPESLARIPDRNAMDKHCSWCPKQMNCQAKISAEVIEG